MPTEAEAEESYQETLYDQACLLLDSMSYSTAHRFSHYFKLKMAAFGPKGGSTSYRVKHQAARTVYTVQCHDIITLTMPHGYPPGRPGFEDAERSDHPECWQLWCHERHRNGSGASWVVSEHATKEAARAALLEARRSPQRMKKVRRDHHAQFGQAMRGLDEAATQ
jgi:hypothetical protein